jgi:predicted Zn-dependent protease
MKIIKFTLMILLFSVFFFSCASMQSAGSAIEKASEDISAEEEYYIGRAVAANITSSYKPYTSNTGLTLYLNQICRAIAINTEKPDLYNGYHLMILDSEEVNAFASSGGHIFVTKGLIRSASSEDSLAGIIAHEVAHIQLQHSIQAIKASRKTDAWVSSGIAALNVASTFLDDNVPLLDDLTETVNEFGDDINGAISNLVDNGYSQVQEFQADNLALDLLTATGYESSTYIEMLRGLEASQAKVSGGFNSTHPSPEARIANAEIVIGNYAVNESTKSGRTERFRRFMTNM